MNEHDSERIAHLLTKDGLSEANRIEDADVVVLNTCCIRENADNKLYGNLGHLKALKDQKTDMKIIVAGCLAQKDRGIIRDRANWVDVVLGTHNVGNAAALLKRSYQQGPIVEILEESAIDEEFFSDPTSRVDLAFSAYVTIQMGCNNSCAFCIVPQVRGPEISRAFGELIREVTLLAAQGVTEITLLGQNVNSYGRDLTLLARQSGVFDPATLGSGYVSSSNQRVQPLFAELLLAVGKVPGISRVRFTSPHPKDLRPETIAAMASGGSVMNQLHFPLQSGSDRILGAMHRGYTSQRYLEKLTLAKKEIDDLAVTTDIIVGFPGESDDDFQATLEVVATAQFDGTFTFIFSPRPGTEAAGFADDFVDPAVISTRFEELKIVTDRSSYAKHRDRIGRVEEVLVSGPSKRNPEMLSGRTRQNKLVHFERLSQVSGSQYLVPGAYAKVEIIDASPHFLRGALSEVVGVPKRKVRIPVASSSLR